MDIFCSGIRQPSVCACSIQFTGVECEYMLYDKSTVLILSSLFGYMGADRFYLHDLNGGLIKLGIFLIWNIYLAIIIFILVRERRNNKQDQMGLIKNTRVARGRLSSWLINIIVAGCVLLNIIVWITDVVLIAQNKVVDGYGHQLFDNM